MNADVFPIVVSLQPEKLLFGGGRGRGPGFLSGGAYKWHFTVTNNYGKHCKFVNCNFRGGSRGRVQGVRTALGAPPPPPDDRRFSNTTGILRKKKLCGLLVSRSNWNLEVLVFKERGNRSTRRKTSRSKEENQQQT